jgi:choline dehydrogenase-like flavoprotein
VDAELRAHDLDNLYIADASVLPTSAAVNPSLTVAALALRLGAHLAARAA